MVEYAVFLKYSFFFFSFFKSPHAEDFHLLLGAEHWSVISVSEVDFHYTMKNENALSFTKFCKHHLSQTSFDGSSKSKEL